MKNLYLVLAVVCIFCPLTAKATITDYSGNEAGFNSEIIGLTTSLIDFDDLTLGDVIYDQYNPPVRFLTNDGFDITANNDGWGTPVHSGILCAQLPHENPDGPAIIFGDLQFSQPVLGVSLWVLDVRPEGLNISIFDKDDVLLSPTFWVGSGGLYTYVGVLSDVKEIARVRVETIWEHDGIGFDDVTVALEPAMVLIPSGSFQMGDHHDGMSNALPLHSVYVDSFYMGKYETTNQQYCDYLNSSLDTSIYVSGGVVYGNGNDKPYCDTHSYDSDSQIDYDDVGGTFSVRTKNGRCMLNDPMVEVSWYGAAAYCNWRSDQEGYDSCYDLLTWECDFSKYGYRLPTEAEWEYSVRGGEHGPYYRFPWGDTISHSQANYYADPCSFPYDVSPTTGFHPDWDDGIYPYTSVVGSFSPNGYGLYDMAGNVWEWCNDWGSSTYYSTSPYDNPPGPASGTTRVLRDGGWWDNGHPNASFCRVANRSFGYPYNNGEATGFRIVRRGPRDWHVDTIIGNDANNGRSRQQAFATINKGIDTAYEDDTVLVWPGVYNETVDFAGKAITVASAADAAVITNVGGYGVRFHMVEGAGSVLTNFVIRDCNIGIQAESSSPTIDHVTVVNNTQGIVADGIADPIITNSILWDNSSGDLIDCDASDSWVQHELGDQIDGLVGYWPFDKGAGPTAYDYSGNGHDGTLNGDPIWVDGISGKALDFDGSGDYVDVADAPGLNPEEAITITAWFKADPFPPPGTYAWPSIVAKYDTGVGGGYDLSVQLIYEGTPKITTSVFLAGGPLTLQGAEPISAEPWYFTAMTYDGTSLTLYSAKIGETLSVVSTSGAGGLVTSDSHLNIGECPYNPGRYFDGVIDEVAIYNRSLSAEEIQQQYQNGLDGLGYHNPHFAGPTNDDYHLKSEKGRFWPEDPTDPNEFGLFDGLWAMDPVTSPCVDNGDPAIDPSGEGEYSGGRVNIGAYGGTAYASRSDYYWPLEGDVNRDGIVNLADFAIVSENWLDSIE